MDATLAKYRDIFDKKAFAYIATVGADGAPPTFTGTAS